MKYSLPLLLFLSLYNSANAEVSLSEQDIKRACQQHAYRLTKELSNEIVSLDSEQTTAAMALANRSCLSYFARVESSSPETLEPQPSGTDNQTVNRKQEESKNWFDKLIEDDQGKDTPADDRLKKRR